MCIPTLDTTCVHLFYFIYRSIYLSIPVHKHFQIQIQIQVQVQIQMQKNTITYSIRFLGHSTNHILIAMYIAISRPRHRHCHHPVVVVLGERDKRVLASALSALSHKWCGRTSESKQTKCILQQQQTNQGKGKADTYVKFGFCHIVLAHTHCFVLILPSQGVGRGEERRGDCINQPTFKTKDRRVPSKQLCSCGLLKGSSHLASYRSAIRYGVPECEDPTQSSGKR